MPETTITQSDNGKAIKLETGKTLTVRLEEVPTSGYRWTVSEVDDTVVAQEGSDFELHSDTGVGGGGLRTFTFKARAPGTTALRIVLRREWDTDNPEEEFRVTVNVRGCL